MKPIKQLIFTNENGISYATIVFNDDTYYKHSASTKELDEIKKGYVTNVEYFIAKHTYRDKHAKIYAKSYVTNKKEIRYSIDYKQCGQCKHFKQTGVYYNETSINNPDTNSLPYPAGICTKHGFGAQLSAYAAAPHSCIFEKADWCEIEEI